MKALFLAFLCLLAVSVSSAPALGGQPRAEAQASYGDGGILLKIKVTNPGPDEIMDLTARRLDVAEPVSSATVNFLAPGQAAELSMLRHSPPPEPGRRAVLAGVTYRGPGGEPGWLPVYAYLVTEPEAPWPLTASAPPLKYAGRSEYRLPVENYGKIHQMVAAYSFPHPALQVQPARHDLKIPADGRLEVPFLVNAKSDLEEGASYPIMFLLTNLDQGPPQAMVVIANIVPEEGGFIRPGTMWWLLGVGVVALGVFILRKRGARA